MQPAVEVSDLTKRYEQVLAVDHIRFAVSPGSTCALLGGNGAGKSTTIAMLLGLLLPTAGRIQVLGVDMLHRRYEVLSQINFSSPYVDLPHRLTVAENLTVFARLYGVRPVAQRLKTIAAELDIAGLMSRPYGQLSAGQKTRVSLAKALLNRPALLLLDEPTASLDPDTADRVRTHLQEYQRNTGATLLLASHNMPEVERMATHVLMMRAGRIVDHGTPQSLRARYARASLEEVFLDIARGRDDVRSGSMPAGR